MRLLLLILPILLGGHGHIPVLGASLNQQSPTIAEKKMLAKPKPSSKKKKRGIHHSTTKVQNGKKSKKKSQAVPKSALWGGATASLTAFAFGLGRYGHSLVPNRHVQEQPEASSWQAPSATTKKDDVPPSKGYTTSLSTHSPKVAKFPHSLLPKYSPTQLHKGAHPPLHIVEGEDIYYWHFEEGISRPLYKSPTSSMGYSCGYLGVLPIPAKGLLALCTLQNKGVVTLAQSRVLTFWHASPTKQGPIEKITAKLPKVKGTPPKFATCSAISLDSRR